MEVKLVFCTYYFLFVIVTQCGATPLKKYKKASISPEFCL